MSGVGGRPGRRPLAAGVGRDWSGERPIIARPIRGREDADVGVALFPLGGPQADQQRQQVPHRRNLRVPDQLRAFSRQPRLLARPVSSLPRRSPSSLSLRSAKRPHARTHNHSRASRDGLGARPRAVPQPGPLSRLSVHARSAGPSACVRACLDPAPRVLRPIRGLHQSANVMKKKQIFFLEQSSAGKEDDSVNGFVSFRT